METLVKHRRTREGRLTREEWLAKALEVLARKGVAGMRIDALSKALGVTKGSFYWHFKNRDDFTKSLLDYWMSAFTTNVRHRISAACDTAGERLLYLMEALSDKRYAKYDVPIRAWAARDSTVDKLVRRTDTQRLDYVRSLFAEMGFKGAELEMRTQTFVVFHSFDEAFLSRMKQPAAERARLMKLRHAFFTRS